MKNRLIMTLAMAGAMSVAMLAGCDEENDMGNETGNGGTVPSAPEVVWVDMGLPSGLLWADRNVGAASPEEYGDYFAWGEVTPKSEYNWSTYRHGSGYNELTKYCSDPERGLNGFTDNLTVLEAGDDAATANLGERAHTPTAEEWEELLANTVGEWTTENGVAGRRFTAENGMSLFLPAAGDRYGETENPNVGTQGDYWTSTLCMSDQYAARFMVFDNQDHHVGNFGHRYCGFSVRAVKRQ